MIELGVGLLLVLFLLSFARAMRDVVGPPSRGALWLPTNVREPSYEEKLIRVRAA